jgi:glycosyltransferase involved in cell wall biosynthesis
MKIIHVIIGLNLGGAESMLARLIETHNSLSPTLRHVVISLTTEGQIGARLAQAGVEVRALGMVSLFQTPWTMVRLFLLLRKERPDIVQTWMYHADLIGGMTARIAGIRRVLWGIRTSDITKGGSRLTLVIRWLCTWLSWFVPIRIVCAAEAAKKLHIALGYRADLMMVIPNGLDVDKMVAHPHLVATLRAEKFPSLTTLVIGMVGRFNEVKGQKNFVEAAGLIARQRPDVSFLMVGRGCDESNPVLDRWIAETGFPQRFVLLGEREDVPVCLAAMDIFVLPSRTEGFPNVLVEAMAMGRPCATTNVGDSALVLGNFGEVVPPDDAHALAQGLERMLAMPTAARLALGLEGRQRIEQEYSMIRCAARFAALYKDVSSEPEK